MAEVGRPKKVRYIQNMPKTVLFSPRGKPGRPEEVELTLDQFEAIKLADFQGFSQMEGALAMRISRPSFGRILRDARAKIADALVNGKIIKITLGDAQVGVRKAEFTQATLKQEVDRFNHRHGKIAEAAALGSAGMERLLADDGFFSAEDVIDSGLDGDVPL